MYSFISERTKKTRKQQQQPDVHEDNAEWAKVWPGWHLTHKVCQTEVSGPTAPPWMSQRLLGVIAFLGAAGSWSKTLLPWWAHLGWLEANSAKSYCLGEHISVDLKQVQQNPTALVSTSRLTWSKFSKTLLPWWAHLGWLEASSAKTYCLGEHISVGLKQVQQNPTALVCTSRLTWNKFSKTLLPWWAHLGWLEASSAKPYCLGVHISVDLKQVQQNPTALVNTSRLTWSKFSKTLLPWWTHLGWLEASSAKPYCLGEHISVGLKQVQQNPTALVCTSRLIWSKFSKTLLPWCAHLGHRERPRRLA